MFLSYSELGFGAYLTNLSVGILVFLLLTKLFEVLFRKKFSPGWKYAAALAMAAVFLIPIRINAPWSIIPIASMNEPLYINSPDLILLDGITEVNSYNTAGGAEGEYLYTLLFYIWAAGAAVTFIYQMTKLAELYRSVKKKGVPCTFPVYNDVLRNVCSELNVKTPRLTVFTETDTPFAMGIFSPKIILPPEGYSEKEAEYIFRHEVCHIKRKDILIKLLLIIFRCINWFNPFAYIMVGNAFADMEITCDEKTTKKFSAPEREEYSKTLLKGASGMKYPAVTTYLSPTAALIKKRIDAVMNIRKFGKVIPFTIAFFSILLLSQTVYAASDDDMRFLDYVYTDPYPMEADPYIISDEWRSAKGSSLEEAGEKIFRQYMEMYMGDDVPEYYRINEYLLQEVIPCDFKNSEKGEERIATKGIFTSHEYVYFKYSYIPANECGNTVHNMNLGGDLHLNGVYNDCHMSFELEKQGGTYTVVNMGTTLTLAIDMPFHFENNLKYTIDKAESMAQAGLLDYSWNDTDNLPDPEDICRNAYALWLKDSYGSVGYEDEIRLPDRILFGGSMNTNNINIDYVRNAGCITQSASGYDVIDPEKISIDESKGFEYCGYDTCLESKDAVIYGNVTGENPHGVKFYLNNEGDEYNSHYSRRLRSVEVTDELFTPHVFHDSFAVIPLPDSLTGAEEILEYMKTPRDGCDFTVMDYRDITEEADGTYAYVRFKGRLDGLYSVDLTYKGGDGYIKTKIV